MLSNTNPLTRLQNPLPLHVAYWLVNRDSKFPRVDDAITQYIRIVYPYNYQPTEGRIQPLLTCEPQILILEMLLINANHHFPYQKINQWVYHPHMLHGAAICPNICHRNHRVMWVNTPYMEHMGSGH